MGASVELGVSVGADSDSDSSAYTGAEASADVDSGVGVSAGADMSVSVGVGSGASVGLGAIESADAGSVARARATATANANARDFKQTLKSYFVLTVVYVAVAATVNVLIYSFAPVKYFGIYPSVNILYWLCGMALEFFLYRYRNAGSEKLLATYMMFRFGQLVLTALFLMVAASVAGYEKLPFAISLMLNYFVFTALELYLYNRYNKRYNKSR
ncbi:hypothetical protein FACS1894159_09480 [Bacteroidia bacterium]|nr:hypothetical protein FACS1894159_09480 [Bacteroidia bacterium]